MSDIYEGITILKPTNNAEQDHTWNSVFRSQDIRIFQDFSGKNRSIENIHEGETVFIVGRGTSLGNITENKELNELFLNDKVTKMCINSAADVLNFNCQYWVGCDRVEKFSKEIFENDKITKLIPINRYRQAKKRDKNFKSNNTIGIQTCLIDDSLYNKISFVEAFCNSKPVIYGYKKRHKSSFLYAIKLCLIMGFKRIVFVGVDFEMNNENPYYGIGNNVYSQFHVKHNESLFKFLIPKIKEIETILRPEISLFSIKHIDAMPFINTIEINNILREEIKRKP